MQGRSRGLLEALLLAQAFSCWGCSGETPVSNDAGARPLDGAPSMTDGAPEALDGSPDGAATPLDGALDGAGPSVDAGSAADALARMVDLCHEWGDIVCRAQQVCCAADERTDASEADCQSRYYVGCDLLHMGDAFLDGRIRMDVGAAEGYIAMMRTLGAACDPDAGTGPGKFLAGTVTAGGDCTPVDATIGPGRDASARLSCVPGLYCDVTTDATGLHGVCRALEGSGGSCSTTNDCDPAANVTCTGGAAGTCVARYADGAMCNEWRDCAGGYCDHMACSSTPHPRWCNM